MADASGRVDRRIDFHVEVRVTQASRLQQFYARNLSRGGIFLEVPGKPLAIGTKLRVQFAIPELKKVFTVDAEVVHMHTFQAMDEQLRKKVARHGVGLRFTNLSPQDEELIQKFIAGKDLRVDK